MSNYLRPGDQHSIVSSADGDDRLQTAQRSRAFEDFEKPFPTTDGEVPAGTTVGAPKRLDPKFADPTVYDEQTFRIPEDRKLGQWSTAALIANRMIGTGIFSMPSTILKATGSPAATLLLWCVGALLAYCGMSVFLELGTALPRSGGEKVYLERIYKKPKYFATCVYAVQFVLLGNTAGNAVSCAKYFLRAINPGKYAISSDPSSPPPANPSEGAQKGLAIGIITVICLIHFVYPKFGGKYLNTTLASIKIGLLLLVIIAGAAAGAGRGRDNPERSNFSGATAWDTQASDGTPGNWAVALLAINYSYRGWENANYVLGEVRDAPKTLRRSAPIAVISIAVLYILANIAYFAALPRERIQEGGVTIAADFFLDVFGNNGFVTVFVPLCIALSAFGNVLAVTFANSRVKQELGKEGALPWSRIWASDKPFGTPGPALLLHWIFSIVVISAPKSDDAYNFVVLLFTYSQSVVAFFIGIGLLYLQYSSAQRHIWRAERTDFHCWWPFTVIHVVSSAFLIITPFIPNKNTDHQSVLTGAIPYWCFPTVGCSVLVLGVLYWVGFAKIWPIFGMSVEVEKDEDVAGNEVIRYKHVRRTRETHTEGSITSARSQTQPQGEVGQVSELHHRKQ